MEWKGGQLSGQDVTGAEGKEAGTDVAFKNMRSLTKLAELWFAQFDSTHTTFVNMRYLAEHDLLSCEGYALSKHRYFPGNRGWIGRYYAFHEFMFVCDLTR